MKKIEFVVWGAGQRCEEFLTYFSDTKPPVAAIIEGNVERQGEYLNNIPIISKDNYLKNYSQYPVIVTPRNFEQSIINDLRSCGILWTFEYWGNTRSDMGGFCVQAPQEKLLEGIKPKTDICIYGWSVLALILYNYLTDNGHVCSLILPKGVHAEIRKYIDNQLGIKAKKVEEIAEGEQIVLATKPDKEDAALLLNDDRIITYYDIAFKREWFYNPALEQFHNIHKGERGFVVANGPSLKISDLDLLHERHEICIGMNRVFAGFPYTQWRPDYYIVIDWAGIEFENLKMRTPGSKANFIGDLAWKFIEKKGVIPSNVYRYHEINHLEGGKAIGFSDDFASGTYWGLSVSYDALQLAVYMGFSEIYLVGQDCCNYDGNPEHQHFVKEYSTRKIILRDELLLSYDVAREYMDQHPDVRIYNATRGGRLEAFPRRDFDSLFDK